jgi:hypothetical protein
MGKCDDLEFDPMFAVVGSFIMSFSRLEFWVYFALGRMTGQWYVDAEDHGVTTAIDRLRKGAKHLPEPHRSRLRGDLLWATDAAELRHAVVHGIWLYDEDKDLFQSQRPKQLRLSADEKAGRTEADRLRHPWIHRTFTVDELVESSASVLSG